LALNPPKRVVYIYYLLEKKTKPGGEACGIAFENFPKPHLGSSF
jgi:hypothetical protein